MRWEGWSYSEDIWWLGNPHPGSLSSWSPVQWTPRISKCSWAQEGGQSCRSSHTLLYPLHCHPFCPAPIPASCSHPSLSPLLLGIQMVSTMAPPPPEWGAGQGGDLTTPIALLAPKPPCFSCCGVCPPPPLCLSSRPPRSSLCPCPPCSLLHSSPTNLSWPLSPPPSSHLLLTGMSLGQ